MCGFIDDVVDSVTDFVSDPIGTIGNAAETVGGAVSDIGKGAYDLQKDLVEYTRGSFDDTLANLDNIFKSNVDLSKNFFTLGTDVVANGVQDPFDVNSWTDPMEEHLDEFNQTGDDLFGTGGWIKAGANYLSTGNPFQGVGSLGYQLDSKLSDSDYTNGQTSGVSNLVNLYNTSSNLYNGLTASPQQGAPMEYSLSDNPEVTGAYNFDNIGFDPTTSGNIPNLDPTQISLQSGSMFPDTSLMSQAGNFLNSGLGKITRAGAGMIDPRLGTVLNGAAGALNGETGKAAFDTLASLYMENKNRKAQKAYQNQMNQQMQTLNNLYTPNSAYAQQLRQELERKDAAAGRRSQYGNRETELMARLADKQAGVAPATNMLASQAYQSTLKEQQQSRSRQLAQLMNLFTPEKPKVSGGTAGPSAASQGWDAIKSVWGSL